MRKFVLILVSIIFLFAETANAQITIAGSNGDNGSYTSLTNAGGAFAALNAGASQAGYNVTISITADVATEAGTNTLTGAAGMWTSLTITPSGNRTISGSFAGALIDLSGADNVNIDGLNSGGNSLIIANTSTSASAIAIRFINDAQNNTIENCTIKGSCLATTSGVIVFGTATGTGNDNNIIDNCNVGPNGTNYPLHLIYALGTDTRENSNNTISNCNLYDFWYAAGGQYLSGIYIRNDNTQWTISGNSFYQTADRTPTGDDMIMSPIFISTDGSGFTITGNYIGGKTSACGGDYYTIDDNAATGNVNNLYCMRISVGTASPTTVSNNTIKNIDFTTDAAAGGGVFGGGLAFGGIIAEAGDIDVTGNTIGSTTGQDAILVRGSTGVANAVAAEGIAFFTNRGSVVNNNIGSITLSGGDAATELFDFIGIIANATIVENISITGNLIGSTTQASSIRYTGTTTYFRINAMYLYQAGAYTVTVQNNTIQNITSSATSALTELYGITVPSRASGSNYIIDNNLIANLTSASSDASTNATAPTGGIFWESTNAGQTISNNTIRDISNTHATGNVHIFGISFSGATTGTQTISKNIIYNIKLSSTSTTANIHGIYFAAGVASFSNNMITLGNGITNNNLITGIFQAAATAGSTFYFNSIYIGGTTTAGTPSRCYYSSTTATRTLTNNILCNARSGGAIRHYAINVSSKTGLSSNYNDFYSVSTYEGRINATEYSTLATFAAAAPASDANSIETDPVFVLPADATTPDLHVQSTSPAIGYGLALGSVLDDIDEDTRSEDASPDGPTIGADEYCGVVGGNAYAIYAPDGSATVTSTYAFGRGGNCGGVAYPLWTGSDDGYTSVDISSYPIIYSGDATNNYSNCTDININMTASGTPNWTGSEGELTGSGSPKTVAYTTLGRKDVMLDAAIGAAGTSNTADYAVTDNGCATPAGAVSPITISGYACEINTANITVQVNISHVYAMDVDILLKAPDNTILELSSDNGGTGDHYTNTIFSDAGATLISAGTAPFTNTYRPEGGLTASCSLTPTVSTFAAISGGSINPNGTWTLYVYDDAAIDAGTLLDWTLNLPATGACSMTFYDFNNMMMDPPDAGDVLGAEEVCSGSTENFVSSEAGMPGYNFLWTLDETGCASCAGVIADPIASQTDITFDHSEATEQIVTVTLTVETECCGNLNPIEYLVTVYPTPAAPSVDDATPTQCQGGSITLSASPADATYNYNWYDAATAGTLLGSGVSYEVNPVPDGGDNYYLEAVSADGCIGVSRTLVALSEENTSPSVNSSSYCAVGIQKLSVDAGPAGTLYTWYSAAVGGSTLQTGFGLQYELNVTCTPTPCTQSVWVAATESGGCVQSARVQVDGSLTSTSTASTWDGSTSTDWFDPTNWSTCTPNCGIDATLASGTPNQPTINFSAGITAGGDGIARTNDINFPTGSTLTFGEDKSILEVCGDWDQQAATTLSMTMGKVSFVGTAAQNFRKRSSTAGDLNNVEINNAATGNAVAITNNGGDQDMVIGSTGNLSLVDGILYAPSGRMVQVNNPAAGSISSGHLGSYVNGTINADVNGSGGSYYFPVGNGTAYELMEITNLAGIAGGLTDLTVSFSTPALGTTGMPLTEGTASYDDVVNNGGASVGVGVAGMGIWTVTPNAGTATYDMALTGRNYSNAQTEHSIIKRANSGSSWTLAGTYGSMVLNGTTSLYTARTGFSGFSDFAQGSSPTPLPIELTDFSVVCDGKDALIRWQTASETNADYYLIEKSLDGVEFISLGKVKAAGNSSSSISYSLRDENQKEENAYYRLTQVDFDGQHNNYNTIRINSCYSNQKGISISSNGRAFVIDNEGDVLNSTINVYDVIGKMIYSERKVLNQGRNELVMDKNAVGLYVVEVVTSEDRITGKASILIK